MKNGHCYSKGQWRGARNYGNHSFRGKEDVSLDRAVSLGAERCVYILKIMVAGLADILAGAEAGVAGPIGVARMAGTVADSGMTALFAFIALLSLNLGF